MSEKHSESKTIKALTVLSVILILLDIIAAGYFIVKGIKQKRETERQEIWSQPEAETSVPEIAGTTTEAATEPTTEAKDDIDIIMEGMSLHEKICQMFIVRPEELTDGADLTVASSATEKALAQYPVGGIIYFEKWCSHYSSD